MRRSRTLSGESRLKRAVQRLARSARAYVTTPDHSADPAQPASDWERATDARLAAIERTITAQNRLLLLTLISIIGDTFYTVTMKMK